jgi:hypothetical protein
MKSKTKIMLKGVPSALITLIIVSGAIMKLTGAAPVADLFEKMNLLPYMKFLGLAECLFLLLFHWHSSRRIGLILLTGYYGGAMAVELTQGMIFYQPAMILSLIWIAAYLRDPSCFFQFDQEKIVRHPLRESMSSPMVESHYFNK